MAGCVCVSGGSAGGLLLNLFLLPFVIKNHFPLVLIEIKLKQLFILDILYVIKITIVLGNLHSKVDILR